MPLTLQISIYMASIAAMLTFMKMISGLTGSQMVRVGILSTATISAVFVFVAGLVKVVLSFKFIQGLIFPYLDCAKVISTLFFLLWMALVLYFFGLGVIVRLYVRSLRFKDWGTIKNLRALPPVSWIRQRKRAKSGDLRDYETYPVAASGARKPKILTAADPWELRKEIIHYISEITQSTAEEINYVCCNVSPANIWQCIKAELNDQLVQSLKQRLVFVDAYTTTFGFEDEILSERVRQMRNHEKVDVVDCYSSAGVHSGTAAAFKILKKKAEAEQRTRRPCTVIYDSLSVLAISETDNEVSEFVIHLTAAELTYDMQTIFLEADVENRKSPVLDVMRACCGSPTTVASK